MVRQADGAEIPPRASRYQISEACILLDVDAKTLAKDIGSERLPLSSDQSGKGKWLEGAAVDRERDKFLRRLGAIDARPPLGGQAESGPNVDSPRASTEILHLRRQLTAAMDSGQKLNQMLQIALGSVTAPLIPDDLQLIDEIG